MSEPLELPANAKVKGRTLIYSGPIDDEFLTLLIHHIERLGKAPRKGGGVPRLVLNSQGGCLYSMLAAIDWIELAGDVTTIATGACMSAAVPIIAAGKKRVATPSTRWMFHATSSEYSERMSTPHLQSEMRELEQIERLYTETLHRVTGIQDRKWWRRTVGKERPFYYGSHAALDMNLIDAILER